MGESIRRGSTEGRLSQLKNNFLTRYPFFPKKGFSTFAFMLIGAGVFPALPPIDTKELAGTDTASVSEVSPALSHEELCHWQRDFLSFVTLMDGKKMTQDIPCTEVTPVSTLADEKRAMTEDEALTRTISELTAGYPLATMAPAIAAYDRSVAALIVGIAKKESNWGKRVPRAPDGSDCFNYWGFKGAGSRGRAMGHGCFGSPEEAVRAVGHRIAELVATRQTSEPKNMIIWKCGSSCATHSPESVRKWIADVDLYYRKIADN